jgi:hypothetical protein
VRYIPYYLIAVHEEAGDECVHAQLIAGRFHLRYRDTSLLASSAATQTLPEMESWVSAWLESSSRPTSELLLDAVDEDGGTACSARNGTDGRDALVAGWPKSNWEGQGWWGCRARTDMGLSHRRFWVKGLPFYGRCGATTVF